MQNLKIRTCLSLREAEVLKYVADGSNNKAISCLLGISTRTVEKHLERIYKKLGVESRTASVVSFYHAVGNNRLRERLVSSKNPDIDLQPTSAR